MRVLLLVAPEQPVVVLELQDLLQAWALAVLDQVEYVVAEAAVVDRKCPRPMEAPNLS